jgi:cardiolipin synthase
MRVAAVPVLILLLKNEYYASALLLFVAAGVSDGLDGYIAKKYRVQSKFGAILDPVADKILLVSCFVMLTLLGHIPFWLLVIVVFRDILIVGGYLLLVMLDAKVQMRPSTLSKLNTLFQICLVSLVLARLAGWIDLGAVVDVLIVVVASTSVLSGIHYVWVWGFGKHSIGRGQ